ADRTSGRNERCHCARGCGWHRVWAQRRLSRKAPQAGMNLRPRLPDRVVLAWSPVCSGEFPQGCQIENRPLELDIECNKCSRKIEHWLERRHLFSTLSQRLTFDIALFARSMPT